MHLISASRRTDIPHYYAGWFRARRLAGFADYRTVYGGGPNGYFRVSLKPEELLGYLFWTRFAGPFHGELKALRKEKVPYAFQYTITGCGREMEPGSPSREAAIKDLLGVAAALPGPEAIQWRYDPILISDRTYGHDWHRKNFRYIASRLAGRTRVVNVSVTEPCRKALAKVPEGHNIAWRKSPKSLKAGLRAAGETELELLRDLENIAGEYGISLRTCCNSEYGDVFPASQCCGAELFAPYGPAIQGRAAALKPAPSREGCRCLKSVDIGMADTCPCGCFYCYATGSLEQARENYRKHDGNGPSLR